MRTSFPRGEDIVEELRQNPGLRKFLNPKTLAVLAFVLVFFVL